ncbi:MAG: hypothetical protein P8Y47_10090, partial [Alphaproteobacteria bacterium]
KHTMLAPARAHLSQHFMAGAILAAAVSVFQLIPGNGEFVYALKVGAVIAGAAAFLWLDVLTFFPFGEDNQSSAKK